jgi:hypothetical protein
MFRAIRAWITRRRFARMTASFDRRIREAQAKHAPVRHIVREKRLFVAECLAASVASQRTKAPAGSAWRGAR